MVSCFDIAFSPSFRSVDIGEPYAWDVFVYFQGIAIDNPGDSFSGRCFLCGRHGHVLLKSIDGHLLFC